MENSADPHITDAELLEKFYQGRDNHWLGILLQRYTFLLFGVCMKYLRHEEDARDSVQQIFLKVLTELPKYRVEYFKSWLYTIARNHCLMKLRDGRQPPLEIREHLTPAEDDDASLNSHWQKDRQFDHMEQALEELAPEQKNCITLFYLEKQTYQQITEKTGFNYMQVKSYIQNGKRNLRIALQKRLGRHE